METSFAPAERLDGAKVEAQRVAFRSEFPYSEVFTGLDSTVLVLNRQRQILETFPPEGGLLRDGILSGLGLRPGEALGCVNAPTASGGCGTTPACRYCGAVQAIVESLDEQIPVKKPCSLRIAGDERESAGEFLATAVPFVLGGETYVLLFFQDRSNEQRRSVMERLFFHDVLNTATGLRMYLELLEKRELPEELREEVRKITGISQTLIDEIEDQKILTSAENGSLQPRRDFLHSLEFLSTLKSQYGAMAAKRGVHLELRPFAEAFLLVTDGRLLHRVVGNMVKNAIEASSAEETVGLGCSDEGGRKRFFVRNPAVMDDESRFKVFTRSFSTKGENRGLGTYSMKLLGEGYLKGTVRCTSSEDDGTEFSITFLGE